VKKQRITLLITSEFTESKQKMKDKKQEDKTKNKKKIWIITQKEEEAKSGLKEY
jgi:hypothetical protein